MRSVIVDAVRAAKSERRGGNAVHVTLDIAIADSLAQPLADVLDIDRSLYDLARLEPRLAQGVEMRYFVGMTETEIAQALGVSDRTVRRDWEKARLLLAQALKRSSAQGLIEDPKSSSGPAKRTHLVVPDSNRQSSSAIAA